MPTMARLPNTEMPENRAVGETERVQRHRPWTTPWIWNGSMPPVSNAFVRFRRMLKLNKRNELSLEISADSRYWLWVNGTFAGSGPARAWPEHWSYDRYDLTRWLSHGPNCIAVLVNHWADGNFQYLAADPGLTARILDRHGQIVDETSPEWRTATVPAEVSNVPRISVQQGYEEQFDARLDDGWLATPRDLPKWSASVVVRPSHAGLTPRSIPFLQDERANVVSVHGMEEVRPPEFVWNISLKTCFAPSDRSANFCFVRGFLTTQVHSAVVQVVDFIRPHHHSGPFWVNAALVSPISLPADKDFISQTVCLRRGWNRILIPYPGYHDAMAADLPAGGVHLPVFVLAVRARSALRWAWRGRRGGTAWAFAGPFPLSPPQRKAMKGHVDYPRVVQATKFPPGATERVARALGKGDVSALAGPKDPAWIRPIPPEHLVQSDVFASWCGDTTVKQLPVPEAKALTGGRGWMIQPPAPGNDVRLLLDFERMMIGCYEFDIEAPKDVIVDLHGFEFIQPDGRHNIATGMNNTMRYICREGRQRYRSRLRRGMQYTWMTLRNLTGAVRIHDIGVAVRTYPQRRQGSFGCSDELVTRIRDIGADTMRWCAEDTYTDCPTYEQTHWVGDARNEALVDWVVNGDSRLWLHCLKQAAQGLKHFPIVPSHVPSAWENVLPAWSFLWMRSCREYYWWSGDRAGAEEVFRAVVTSAAGIEAHIGDNGLFQMRAWNLFDWAAMETPADGTVTHVNCLAVLALREAAELARWLGRMRESSKWENRAKRMSAAINRILWDAERCAYADCLLPNGRMGKVRSQQTQAAALLAGVATGRKESRCRELVEYPPEGFVRAGSPFFVFFQLELLARWRDGRSMLDLIRRDWGFMLGKGASSFWELWTLSTGRLSRSHCHGWSAAPTYFLSSAILGVTPGAPGSREIYFYPLPGDLASMSGSVPTPWGVVEVAGFTSGSRWKYEVRLPAGCRLVAHRSPDTRVIVSKD